MTPYIHTIRQAVRAIPPGCRLQLNAAELKEMVGRPTPGWNPADQVLSGIIGAAWEYWYTYDQETPTVTFYRRPEPLTDERFRTYVEPDRRERFRKIRPGFYQHI